MTGLTLSALALLGFQLTSHAASDSKAGSGQRWVIGSQVNLRSQATPDAEVVKRMALNTPVELLATLPGGKFCEVAVAANGAEIARGFTACQYLGLEPLSKKRIGNQYLDNGEHNPNFNPVQAFWLAPSYEALNAYGEYLEETKLTPEQRGSQELVRPPVEEFERMKAHLAKGIFGSGGKPYPSWDSLKRSADTASTPDGKSPDLVSTLGSYDIDEQKARGLVKAIELPTITSSYFQRMDDIAPPADLAEQISGRFQIIHTIQTRGREMKRDQEKWLVAGTWDVGQVIKSLTKPVTKIMLFKDGAIAASSTHLKRSFIEWSENDGPMCEGYEDGYMYGDSDPKIWIGYGMGKEAYQQSLKTRPKNSLLYFYTRSPLPEQKAAISTTKQKLNRENTGFVTATSYYYDLNNDGVVDLAVWEGSGKSQGHMGGETTTDDPYQRLFFVNIAGRWHLLGSDRFGYGCGC